MLAGLCAAGSPEARLPAKERPSSAPATASAPASQPVRRLSEVEKIEALIRVVEGLKSTVFIRNGTEHNCKAAAKHMRDKWNWKRDEIKTARDFIRVAGTGSSMSGRPYMIRLADGKQVRSADFLMRELRRIEGDELTGKERKPVPSTSRPAEPRR